MSTVIQLNDRPRLRTETILNHGVLRAYPGDLLDGVAGVDYYGARVLASSYPGDICQFHPDLADRGLLNPILSHYKRIGLRVADRFIFDESWEIAKEHPEHVLDAFYFGEEANEVSNRPRFASIAERLNDKNEFIKLCHRLGVPVPGTVMFQNPQSFSDAELPPLPVYVKGAISASGMHVVRCETAEELLKAISKMPGPFQVQEALPEGTLFYNIQYEVIGGQLHHGPLTKQKLDGNAHNGNVFPSGIELDMVQPHTDKLAHEMFESGMEGTWAFDVAVHTRQAQTWAIEANPRWNGASYYSKPAERLKARAWEGQYVRTKHDNFDFMFRDPSSWEYSPDRLNGIVLINWATISSGKLGLLIIGDDDQRQTLLETFKSRYC